MQTKASILIVDDETFIRQILSRIVTREGYQVRQACDGVDALNLLAENSYDIVISDIKMPNMDGIQLLSEVKSKYPNISVVLITAYAGETLDFEWYAEAIDDTGGDEETFRWDRVFEYRMILRSLGCLGDLNDDTYRNLTDFSIFAPAYGTQVGDPDYNPDADFNGDGFVNITDFTHFTGVYGTPCP